MKVTRRSFLASAPAVIGAILVADKFSFAQGVAATGGAADTLANLGWRSFLPYVKTNFSFYDEAGAGYAFRLDGVDDLRTARHPHSRGECFSVMFSSSARCPLEQGTYDVRHFALGEFRLLVTVQHSTNRRRKYEAIINRITE